MTRPPPKASSLTDYRRQKAACESELSSRLVRLVRRLNEAICNNQRHADLVKLSAEFKEIRKVCETLEDWQFQRGAFAPWKSRKYPRKS